MATSLARAEVRDSDGVAVVDLDGDINAAAEPALTAAYEEATANGSTSVVLNFEQVSYINSTGIALIVGLLARARKESRKITACGLNDHYKEIFEITRLADFMPMFDDEAAAISESAD